MKTVRILLLLLVLIGSIIGIPSMPRPALAYAPPASRGRAFYVPKSWGNTVTFNGNNVLSAYQKGYQVNAGSSNVIILDFGRQYYNTSTNSWEVVLVNSNSTHKTNSWVTSVAQSYLLGYNDGHLNQQLATTIIIGTNNSNYPWQCDNNGGGVSTDWYNSGLAWGTIVQSLTVPNHVYLESGNDFESWKGTTGFGTWSACGAGAMNWLIGYQDRSTRFNANYGSDGSSENPNQWTIAQVYLVSWGQGNAVPYPEIYCSGQPPQWVAIRRYATFMQFYGVTSDNAQSSICNGGTKTYAWLAAWNALNNALTNAGAPYGPYPDNLERAVASFS